MWSALRTTRLPTRNGHFLTRLPPSRAASTSYVPATTAKQKHRAAKQLVATGNWDPIKRGSKRKKRPTIGLAMGTGDRTRVNVVSEKLCGDITKYIGPTLERHVGCDIIDINPGAGVWSTQLHDVLKPRSHILMEPDADLYKPFLEPLLSRPGTRLVPKSGILWKELLEAMGYLEHQVEQASGASTEPKRNDTLIVTANLAFFPRKPYRRFDSIAILVLYQLLSSVQFGSLFQKYGLVRMLLWINDDDKRTFLPRSMQNRKKSALQAEFASEWFAEVAGRDSASIVDSVEALKKRYMRDHGIDLASASATLDRMKELGIDEPPKHRRMELTEEAIASKEGGKKASGLLDAVQIERPRRNELRALEKRIEAGEFAKGSEEWARCRELRKQFVREDKENAGYMELLADLHELRDLHASGKAAEPEFAEKEAAYNEKVRGLSKNNTIEYRLIRDNLHLFQQDPPVLLYDRRPYEPLRVEPDEFFPNAECALLDIQPKAMNPLLRDVGPGSQRAGDIFDIIQRSMLFTSLDPISSVLDKLWPCGREGIHEHCPSLTDPAAGGVPGSGYAEVCPRVLNEKQWMEILGAFMKWPFRPTYAELLGRLGDDSSEVEPDKNPIDTGI